jgi:hypothetical protein
VAILRNHALTRRRRPAVPIPHLTARIQLLAAAMAAEALGLLMAEAVELLMAVAARHMVAEVAVHTAIVKISVFHKGPPRTNEAGLFFPLAGGSKSQPTTLSSLACLISSSSPGVSKFDKAFGPQAKFSSEDVIVGITQMGPNPLRPAPKESGLEKRHTTQ